MFAVVKHGGKQYRVEPGFTVLLEKIDAEEGASVVFEDLSLIVSDDTSVSFSGKAEGVVVRHVLDDKVIAFKKRRRHFGSKRLRGHRQKKTLVLVNSVVSD